VVLLVLIILSTTVIALRRKTAPDKVVPLHPSTFILNALAAGRDFPQLSQRPGRIR
jgi:hypothetical protein